MTSKEAFLISSPFFSYISQSGGQQLFPMPQISGFMKGIFQKNKFKLNMKVERENLAYKIRFTHAEIDILSCTVIS